MSDQQEDKKQRSTGETIIRWAALGNEAIGSGITNALAGLGFLTIDAINNAPRLVGLGKMSQKPVMGSDWIKEKMTAGKAATDGAMGVIPPKPETTGEKVFSKGVEIVTEIAIPVKGASLLKGAAPAVTATAATVTVGKTAARVEPTMTAAADDAATAAGKIKKTFDPRAENAARKASEEAAAKAAKETAEDVGEAAGRKLSRKEIKEIRVADGSYSGKLDKLFRYGEGDEALLNQVILNARKTGISAEDVALIRKMEHVPKEVAEKLSDIQRLQSNGGIRALADKLGATAHDAVIHPVRSAWDAFALQWRAPISTVKVARENPKTALAIGAGVIGADAATDGAVSDIGGKAIGGAYGLYWEADKAILGTGARVIGGAAGLVSEDAAEAAVDATTSAGGAIIRNAPGFAVRFLSGATGTDPAKVEKFLDESPALRWLLPSSARTLLMGRDATQEIKRHTAGHAGNEGAGDSGQSASPETGTAGAETIRQRAAAAADAARERGAGAVESAQEKGAAAAERARQLAEKAKEAGLVDKALKLIEKNPMAGLFGLWGLYEGKGIMGKSISFAFMAAMGTLIAKIWPGANQWLGQHTGDLIASVKDTLKDMKADGATAVASQDASKQTADAAKPAATPAAPAPVLAPAAVAKVGDPAVAASNDAKPAQSGMAAALNDAGKPLTLALAPVGPVGDGRDPAANRDHLKQLANAPSWT